MGLDGLVRVCSSTAGAETGPWTWGCWQSAPFVHLPLPKPTNGVVLVGAVSCGPGAFTFEVTSTHLFLIPAPFGWCLGRSSLVSPALLVLALSCLAHLASFALTLTLPIASTLGGRDWQRVAACEMLIHLSTGPTKPTFFHHILTSRIEAS